MKETVSVVIPTLNEQDNIKSCLNSLANQIEKPFEIIVVDNGSSDKTRVVVSEIKSKLRKKGINLKLFYHPFGNQTNAREFGFKKSRGTIIGSLDAEACPSKDWISKIKKYFENPKIVGIGGKSSFRNKGWIFNFFNSVNYYLRIIINLYGIGGGNSAFRKAEFFSVKGFHGLEKLRKEKNIIFAKDDFFLSKKLEQKGRLKFCPDLKVTLLYRVRNKKTKKYKDKYYILDILKRIFLEIIYDYKITRYFKKNNFK